MDSAGRRLQSYPFLAFFVITRYQYPLRRCSTMTRRGVHCPSLLARTADHSNNPMKTFGTASINQLIVLSHLSLKPQLRHPTHLRADRYFSILPQRISSGLTARCSARISRPTYWCCAELQWRAGWQPELQCCGCGQLTPQLRMAARAHSGAGKHWHVATVVARLSSRSTIRFQRTFRSHSSPPADRQCLFHTDAPLFVAFTARAKNLGRQCKFTVFGIPVLWFSANPFLPCMRSVSRPSVCVTTRLGRARHHPTPVRARLSPAAAVGCLPTRRSAAPQPDRTAAIANLFFRLFEIT